MIQLSGLQIYNTSISSIKLDGVKTYLIWSWQCIVSLKIGWLIDYVTGDKKQLKSNDSTFEQWEQ